MAGEVMIFVKTSPKPRKIKDGGWRAAFGEKVLIYRRCFDNIDKIGQKNAVF